MEGRRGWKGKEGKKVKEKLCNKTYQIKKKTNAYSEIYKILVYPIKMAQHELKELD